MDAQSTQFDSHRFVKRLTKAGLSEEAAEILADEHTRLIVPGDVATKADVARVDAKAEGIKADLARVDAKVEGIKADVAELDAKVEGIKAEMVTKAYLHQEIAREIAASEARTEQRMRNAILQAKVSLIKWMIATMMVFSGIVIGAMTALR